MTEPELIIIRGIRFQIFRDEAGRATDIIALRLGATMPIFRALRPSSLIYDVAAEDQIVALFRDEEGKHLAGLLGCSASTIWDIRRCFGLAQKQIGNSRTTRWRHAKLTHHETSVDPEADFEEEA